MFSEKPPAAGIRDLSIMALALDLTRTMLSLPYKLDSIIDFDFLVMMATQEAIKEKVLHASAPHAP